MNPSYFSLFRPFFPIYIVFLCCYNNCLHLPSVDVLILMDPNGLPLPFIKETTRLYTSPWWQSLRLCRHLSLEHNVGSHSSTLLGVQILCTDEVVPGHRARQLKQSMVSSITNKAGDFSYLGWVWYAVLHILPGQPALGCTAYHCAGSP